MHACMHACIRMIVHVHHGQNMPQIGIGLQLQLHTWVQLYRFALFYKQMSAARQDHTAQPAAGVVRPGDVRCVPILWALGHRCDVRTAKKIRICNSLQHFAPVLRCCNGTKPLRRNGTAQLFCNGRNATAQNIRNDFACPSRAETPSSR